MKRNRGQMHRIFAMSSAAKSAAVLALSMGFALSPSFAFAQDKGLSSAPLPKASINLNGPSSNSGFVGLSPSLRGAMIELPADAIGSSLFDLDLRNQDCLSGSSTCIRNDYDKLDVVYNKPFKGVSVSGLDLQLTPRAAVSFDDDTSSALVGALVRIGDNLREGSNLKSNTWYVFAGADAEAVTYSPNSVSRLTSGNFHLQDRIIVGDAQAGIGYKIGDADVSLGYFRREVSSFSTNDPSDDFSKTENAAALSFTWRR